MRVAVSGANGRLGRALIAALEAAPFTGPAGPIAWNRRDLDLDTITVESATALLRRDRPEVVIHAAAWTDVDGCARDPELALRRNGAAVGRLAQACAARGVGLAVVSTNEVFDGTRTDGLGYAPDDEPRPINPYGASKLAGEVLARAAMGAGELGRSTSEPSDAAGAAGTLAIVRTSWLHGPPGNDFPAKIAAAADRAAASGEPLRVVGDEVGGPTYTPDLAEAVVELIAEDALLPAPGEPARVHHLVNGGRASRADWAREVLRATGIAVELVEVPAATWERASTPPRWAVLAPTPLPSGEPMRDWRAALADALPALLRSRRAG